MNLLSDLNEFLKKQISVEKSEEFKIHVHYTWYLF